VSTIPRLKVRVKQGASGVFNPIVNDGVVIRTVAIDSGSSGSNRLDLLTDVNVTSIQDGDVLIYDADTDTFVSGDLGAIDGGTF
jgi:hypothetical protein